MHPRRPAPDVNGDAISVQFPIRDYGFGSRRVKKTEPCNRGRRIRRKVRRFRAEPSAAGIKGQLRVSVGRRRALQFGLGRCPAKGKPGSGEKSRAPVEEALFNRERKASRAFYFGCWKRQMRKKLCRRREGCRLSWDRGKDRDKKWLRTETLQVPFRN